MLFIALVRPGSPRDTSRPGILLGACVARFTYGRSKGLVNDKTRATPSGDPSDIYKMGTRTDRAQTMEDKTASVEAKMGG